MKIKWKVGPAITGRYRSFERRAWPHAEYEDGQYAVAIRCEQEYIPKDTKSGNHPELKIVIFDYSSGERVPKILKLRAKTIQEAKAISKSFLDSNPHFMPKKEEINETIKIDGQLEIDQERGVIYFHSKETGHTALRICSLPKPIPNPSKYGEGLDITHMHSCSWRSK